MWWRVEGRKEEVGGSESESESESERREVRGERMEEERWRGKEGCAEASR